MRFLPMFVILTLQYASIVAQEYHLRSPNAENRIAISISDTNISYRVSKANEEVISASPLGLTFANWPTTAAWRVLASATSSADTTWETVIGEDRFIRDNYRQLELRLQSGDSFFPIFVLTFRAYDDGVALRYGIESSGDVVAFTITDENTGFYLSPNDTCWWIPAENYQRYESLYTKAAVSSIGMVHTPLTVKKANGLYLSIHEANLTDYAAMLLENKGEGRLVSHLVPWSNGDKVYGMTPFVSPWRSIQIGGKATDLASSKMILNLNPPNRISDPSWIRPMRYVGIWWGMHIRTFTWHPGPKHGATTANALRYIDFAAANNIEGVLIEGWNKGWEYDWYRDGSDFRFFEPYPDFDIAKISAYARSRGVEIIGHHETGAAVSNYAAQMDSAFAFYRQYGIKTIKTGYVGDLVDQREYPHGQFMVRHYRRVLTTAAKYKLMINAHEPIKDTGIRRTWPNMLSREGARGQEYNAWAGDGGNPPSHTVILPFTRMLAGPFDHTPGIFALRIPQNPNNQVNTTLAKQLALYIILYSPLQMAADLPENYEAQPAFDFIRTVPVDWQKTLYLDGAIGSHVMLARQARNSDEWYLACATNAKARTLTANLLFLPQGREYLATIYSDSATAHYHDNPTAIRISEQVVTSSTSLTLRLAAGGGAVIRLQPQP
jgi:alpha-glucosidase